MMKLNTALKKKTKTLHFYQKKNFCLHSKHTSNFEQLSETEVKATRKERNHLQVTRKEGIILRRNEGGAHPKRESIEVQRNINRL